MRQSIRSMIVPFFVILFPAIHFISRNVTTTQFPPDVEPTTAVIIGALGIAIGGASVIAAIVSVGVRAFVDEQAPSRIDRIIQPDRPSLTVFFGCLVTGLASYLVVAHGFGPDWLELPLLVVGAPLGLPLAVVGPVAIGSWIWTIIGLALCPIWISFLSTLIVDYFDHVHRGQRRSPASKNDL